VKKALGKRAFKPYRGPVDSKALLAELSARTITRFGIRLKVKGLAGAQIWSLADAPGAEYPSKREAVRAFLSTFGRRFGTKAQLYTLRHTAPTWDVTRSTAANIIRSSGSWKLIKGEHLDYDKDLVAKWLVRPTRSEIAAAIRRWRKLDPRPSFRKPNTLGWRTFAWHPTKHCLMSPSQGTLWTEPELRVEDWQDKFTGVRNHAGIHACRLPRGDWRKARPPQDMPQHAILTLVERAGKFVLGTEGWRAEWVLIKEILAPDEATARALRRTYPEIPISVAHEGHWLKGVN
jgi:hypothetical protein